MAGEKSYFLHRFVFAQDATSRGDRPIISSSLCAEAAHSIGNGTLHRLPRVQRVVEILGEIGVPLALAAPPGVGNSTIGGLATHYGMRMLDLEDVHNNSQAVKVRMLLDEWYEHSVLSEADTLVTSDGCAQQVLMDVCTAAIKWLAEAAKEAARLCLQDGYGALYWRGGRPHSHAAWKIALSRCATARRASRFLRMSDEYKIDVGHLMRSAALVEHPLQYKPTRIVAIVWGCARALWTRILEFVRATVAPAGKVSTGCALRFANVGSLEHFVRGVYAVDQLKPEGLALKLRSLAPCAREALVLNLSVPYPLYRPKGTLLNGSTGPDISIVMEDLKFRVRAHFGPQIANYTHDISFHVGDNEAVHTRHMDFILSGWSSGAHHRVGAPYTCGIWQLGRLTQLPNIGAPPMAQVSNGTPPTATRSTGATQYWSDGSTIYNPNKRKRNHVDSRVVLITGASRSGKTTLGKEIVRHYFNTSVMISQDKYRNSSAAPAMVDGRRCLDGANHTDWGRFERAVIDAKRNASLIVVEGYTVCAAPPSLMHMADVVIVIESTIDQTVTRRTKQNSYPTRNGHGEEGWHDAESYVRGCVWPKHVEYMADLARLCAAIPAVVLHASSTVKMRYAQVIDAIGPYLESLG